MSQIFSLPPISFNNDRDHSEWNQQPVTPISAMTPNAPIVQTTPQYVGQVSYPQPQVITLPQHQVVVPAQQGVVQQTNQKVTAGSKLPKWGLGVVEGMKANPKNIKGILSGALKGKFSPQGVQNNILQPFMDKAVQFATSNLFSLQNPYSLDQLGDILSCLDGLQENLNLNFIQNNLSVSEVLRNLRSIKDNLSSWPMYQGTQKQHFIGLMASTCLSSISASTHPGYEKIKPSAETILFTLFSQGFDLNTQSNRYQLLELFNRLEPMMNELSQASSNSWQSGFQSPTLTNDPTRDRISLMTCLESSQDPNKKPIVLSFVWQYLGKYYGYPDGSYPEQIRTQVSSIVNLVNQENFNIKNADTKRTVENLLTNLDNIKNFNGNSNQGPPEPSLTGDINGDQDKFVAWFFRLTDYQQKLTGIPGMIKFMKKYYGSSDGNFYGNMFPVVERVKNKMNEHNVNQDELVQLLNQMKRIKNDSENAMYLVITGNCTTDSNKLIDLLQYITPSNKPNILNYCRQYLDQYFAGKDNGYNSNTYPLVKRLIDIIEDPNFSYQFYTKKVEIEQILSQLQMLKKPDSPVILSLPPLTGNVDKDQQSTLEVISMITSENKQHIVSHIMKYFTKYYSNSDGSFSPEINSLVTQCMATINSPYFTSHDQNTKNKLNDLLKQINTKFNEICPSTNSQGDTFLPPKLTGDLKQDQVSLIQVLKLVSPRNKQSAINWVIDLLKKHYGNAEGEVDNIYSSFVVDFINTIADLRFSMENPATEEKMKDLLNKMDEVKQRGKSGLKPLDNNAQFMDMMSEIQASKSLDQAQYVERLKAMINTRYALPDGSFPPSLQELIKQLLNTLQAREFNINNPETKKSIINMIHRLDDEYRSLQQGHGSSFTKNIPSLTGNKVTDLKVIWNVLENMEKDTKEETVQFVVSYFNNYYTNPSGGYNSHLVPVIEDILNVVSSDGFRLQPNRNKLQKLFDKLDGTSLQMPQEQFIMPTFNGDYFVDLKVLLSNLARFPDRLTYIKTCSSFLTKYYGNKDGTFPNVISPWISRIMDHVSRDDLDPINPATQELLKTDFDQLRTYHQSLNQPVTQPTSTHHAQPVPTLTGEVADDINLVVGYCKLVTPDTKPEYVELVTSLFKLHFADLDSTVYNESIYPFLMEVINYINRSDVNLKTATSTKFIRDKLTKINDKFKMLSESSSNTPPLPDPKLTGNMMIDIETYLSWVKNLANTHQQKAIPPLMNILYRYFATDGNLSKYVPSYMNRMMEILTNSSIKLNDSGTIDKLRQILLELARLSNLMEGDKKPTPTISSNAPKLTLNWSYNVPTAPPPVYENAQSARFTLEWPPAPQKTEPPTPPPAEGGGASNWDDMRYPIPSGKYLQDHLNNPYGLRFV